MGAVKNVQVGPAVRAGTSVILKSQNKEGGWGYNPNPKQSGDLSITIVGIEALVSAKEAGVLVPDNSLERAKSFIYACQSKETGAFWYKPNRTDETNAYRMGAGLLGLQLAGDLSSESLDRGWKFLMGEGVENGWAFKERRDWLDQFYCVQACYQSGDRHIRFWYPKAAERMIGIQEASGKIGGDGDMPHGGTAVATLVLGFLTAFSHFSAMISILERCLLVKRFRLMVILVRNTWISLIPFLFLDAVEEIKPSFDSNADLQYKEIRKWTDVKGRTIEAAFIDIDGSNLYLEWNGKKATLPLSMFSENSLKLAKELKNLSPIVNLSTNCFTDWNKLPNWDELEANQSGIIEDGFFTISRAIRKIVWVLLYRRSRDRKEWIL